MKVVIFGSNGLLGRELQKIFSDAEVFAWSKDDLDITDFEAVKEIIMNVKPEVMLNAVACNAVDKIETDESISREAFVVNSQAVYNMAKVALEVGSFFVHFSTDYVFGGDKKESYVEDAPANPLNAYGRSKREGEEMVLKLAHQGLLYYLIRTSRLFGTKTIIEGSDEGKETFPDLVLRLASERDSLEFIEGSEISSPTYVVDLAKSVKQMLIDRPPVGVYHRSNDGSCSWYEFARTILDFSSLYTTREGDNKKKFIELIPVAASDVPRPALRPKYSVLETTKLPPLRPWSEAVKEYIDSEAI